MIDYRLFAEIYLIIGGVIAGWYLKSYKNDDNIVRLSVSFICHLLFWLPVLVLTFIWALSEFLLDTFQVPFFWGFYVLGKFKDVELHILQKQNNIANNRFNTNSIHDRIYRYGVKLINKRNNYTHE